MKAVNTIHPGSIWLWMLIAVLVGSLALLLVSQAGGTVIPPPQQEVFVICPAEGHFMVAENFGDPPLVVVGDSVEPGTIVGYVQSMEQIPVIAGVGGTVVEIMTGNMEPVGTGQMLMRVVPHWD